MGGATVAFPQDRLAASNNPAGMALVPAGWDAGLRVMNAIREAELDCRGIGACDTVVGDRSSRDVFAIPNGGWSRRLSDTLTVGISVYGNGGINSVRPIGGKLARYLQGKGFKPMLVAADVQRPAAIDQLKVLGETLKVPVYSEAPGWLRVPPAVG